MKIGKCHLCEPAAGNRVIRYCGACDHWFCSECRRKYWHRGWEAIKQLIGGKSPGCCGPQENVDARSV